MQVVCGFLFPFFFFLFHEIVLKHLLGFRENGGGTEEEGRKISSVASSFVFCFQ